MFIPVRFFRVLYLLFPRVLSGINVKIPGRHTLSNRKKRRTVLTAVKMYFTVNQ